jgi:hypothetical protein
MASPLFALSLLLLAAYANAVPIPQEASNSQTSWSKEAILALINILTQSAYFFIDLARNWRREPIVAYFSGESGEIT